MPLYHIIHTHSAQTCLGAPNPENEKMDLWREVGKNAEENNVEIKFFKVNPTEHTFFLLLDAKDYSDIEKTIGKCKKTGDFTITPVTDHTFF